MTRLPVVAMLTSLAAPASADTCWTHEGSLLRLVAAGDYRALIYEHPRAGLRVEPGARLFEGVEEDGWLVGSALDTTAACEGRPALYVVEGAIGGDPPRLDLGGEREELDGCRRTGRRAIATLHLAFAQDC